MSCRWMRAPDGQWVVLIPEHEVALSPHGAGTYHVEHRDGTSKDVLVAHVGSVTRRVRGVECRVGRVDAGQSDRAARVSPLSHTPDDPHRVRLTKGRDHVIAPMSVLDRSASRHAPIEVDDLAVWVDDGDDWHPWPVDGVRMGRAPVVAARRLVDA